MIIKVLDSAEGDLVKGYYFYERKAEGLGNYFLDSLYSDIASLNIYAGSFLLQSKKVPFKAFSEGTF